MIVVTPYLVKPVSDSEIVLPTDGFKAANDAERFLLNRNHSGTGDDRPKPKMAPATPTNQSFGSLESPAPTKSAKKSQKSGSTAPGFSFDK